MKGFSFRQTRAAAESRNNWPWNNRYQGVIERGGATTIAPSIAGWREFGEFFGARRTCRLHQTRSVSVVQQSEDRRRRSRPGVAWSACPGRLLPPPRTTTGQPARVLRADKFPAVGDDEVVENVDTALCIGVARRDVFHRVSD